ncbi:MAG: hypothetical protein ABL997_00380, partial [Planctomycetota bacterium]
MLHVIHCLRASVCGGLQTSIGETRSKRGTAATPTAAPPTAANPISVHTMVSTTSGRSAARVALVAAGYSLLGMVAAGCGGGGTVGSSTVDPGVATTSLSSVEFGRVADIYGTRTTGLGQTVELFRKDVLIGRDIRDERIPGTPSEGKTDAEVRYDFLSADADTLQPRVFLPREIGSAAFEQLFNDLDNDVSLVTPM